MNPLFVPKDERGRLRVFAISALEVEAAEWVEQLTGNAIRADDSDNDQSALAAAFGINYADLDFIEAFAVKDLDGVGLVSYLEDANGIKSDDISPDRIKLAALEGYVLLVWSSAFGGFEVTLNPDKRLTLIGSYREEGVDWTGEALAAQAAAPFSSAPLPSKKPMSDARMGGMVATAVLLFLAAFVVIFVWLAG